MRRTVVTATFLYPLIWDRGQLEIRIEDKTFQVVFEREHWQDTDQRPPSGQRGLSTSNLELPYDRLGRVAHTRVEIYFPMYVEVDSETLDDQELVSWVHAVINRLLSVYRYTTGEFHVDTVPQNELGLHRIRTIDEGGGAFDSPESLLPIGISHASWLTVERTQPVPDEARRILRDGTELPIPRVLYLNAKREQLFENYRIAVVEAETAFEALIDQVIAQYYRGQGHSTAEIENKLRDNLTNLVKHQIPRCCGKAFEGTPEHTAWQADLYQLRNSVVHDGASVNPQEAQRALNAAETAMAWIEFRTP